MLHTARLASIVFCLSLAFSCDPQGPASIETEPSVEAPPRSTAFVPEQKKMLVYCHPRIIQKRGDHFLWDFFTETVEKNGSKINNFKISSVDVLPGGTWQGDAFSADFAKNHKDEFDLVFVPDCGGNWFHYQDPVLNLNGIYDLVSAALSIVKPGGKLLVSKFIAPNLANLIAAKFNGKVLNTTSSPGDFVEIVKK